MLNNNSGGGFFRIDPAIVEDHQEASTIHESYSENYGLSALGLRPSVVRRNLSPTVLIEKAIRNGEGILTDTGALAVTTGKFTGRSPHDKYIVDTDGVHEAINWGDVNHPISRDVFNAIRDEMIGFLSQLTHCIAITLMTCNDKENMEKFTGDSFRDLTRIARINDLMWSELFVANKPALLEQMDLFMDKFQQLKTMLEQEDIDGMRAMMRHSTQRRALFDKP